MSMITEVTGLHSRVSVCHDCLEAADGVTEFNYFLQKLVFFWFNFNCQLDMVLLVWSGVKYRALLFSFLWFHRICPTFSPSFQKNSYKTHAMFKIIIKKN